MSKFGSFDNQLMATMVNTPEPVIGMAATVLEWTDREVYRVTDIKGKKVCLQRDHAKRVVDARGLFSGPYVYTADPQGAFTFCLMCKDGKWHEFGLLKERVVLMGVQDEYYDPSF